MTAKTAMTAVSATITVETALTTAIAARITIQIRTPTTAITVIPASITAITTIPTTITTISATTMTATTTAITGTTATITATTTITTSITKLEKAFLYYLVCPALRYTSYHLLPSSRTNKFFLSRCLCVPSGGQTAFTCFNLTVILSRWDRDVYLSRRVGKQLLHVFI